MINTYCLRLLKSFLLAITAGIILPAALPAMPPFPQENGSMKANQVPQSYYMKNRNRLHENGVNAPGDLLTKRKTGLTKANVSREINILAILIDFSDKPAQAMAAYFDTLIYEDISGSVMNYYKEVSYNTLTITTAVIPSTFGWQRAPETYDYYCNGQNGLGGYPNNARKLVEDAVDLVDPYVDFSNYDNDSDGEVDGLIIIHSGTGAEKTGSSDDIWSHKWTINARLVDGVYVKTYTMDPEYWNYPEDMTCGVFCHELGHMFGLPDLYDTDLSSNGIGKWSLMASGAWNGTLGNSPAHLDAWCKEQLGFVITEQLVSNQTNISIPAVENNPTVYKLTTDSLANEEYFLVENRQQISYDSHLPGNGLLIWHIYNSQSNNNSEWMPENGVASSTNNYKVALIQADNNWDLEKCINRGDSGDPFPGLSGNNIFNSNSSPNSYSYSGTASNVSVVNISNSGAIMTADMGIGIEGNSHDDNQTAGNLVLNQNFPNPFNSMTTISFQLKQAGFAEIAIFDISGRLVKKVFSGNLSVGLHNFVWDGSNQSGFNVGSGVYLYRISLNNTDSLYRKMLLIK